MTLRRLAYGLGMGLVVSAAAWGNPLADQILQAPSDQVDAILQSHPGQLGDALLADMARQGMDAARHGNLADGWRTVQLADHVDAWRKANHRYEAACQNALAIDLLQQRRYNDAITVECGVVKAHPELFRPRFLLASAYLQNGQVADGVSQLETATQLAPDNEESHLELAYAYLREERRADALREFQRVQKINPDNGRARDAIALLNGQSGATSERPANGEAARHFSQAESLFESQHYREAIGEYRLALAEDPKLSSAAVFMGDAWLQLGDNDSAVSAYRQAIAINPRNRQAHRFLGDLYEKRFDTSHDRHDLDAAIQAYKDAVHADPTYQTAVDDLARAQARKSTAP